MSGRAIYDYALVWEPVVTITDGRSTAQLCRRVAAYDFGTIERNTYTSDARREARILHAHPGCRVTYGISRTPYGEPILPPSVIGPTWGVEGRSTDEVIVTPDVAQERAQRIPLPGHEWFSITDAPTSSAHEAEVLYRWHQIESDRRYPPPSLAD